MQSNQRIEALGHHQRACSASYAAFGLSIGGAVPVLGTGENKGRWGAWGGKIADHILEAVGRDEIHRRFELR